MFGFSALEATTASLAVVAASAAAGALPRIRLKQVRVKQALTFWALGIVGTLAGSRLTQVVPESLVLTGFAVVMLAAAVAMWRKSSSAEPAETPRRAAWLLPVVALAVGLLTGLFGVGGGFLIVPALVLVFGLPFSLATGTSLVVVALNSVTALGFRADTWGSVTWTIPLLVIVGGLVGSVLASRASNRMPRKALERGFAVLLVVLALWLPIDVWLLTS